MLRILIIHTPSQLEEASSLVDLLEASLALPEEAIVCSSLPGYTLTTRAGVGMQAGEFARLLNELAAAIALVDEPALCDGQFWFDAAAVWSRGTRLAVIVDDADRRAQLPSQIASAAPVVRSDRASLISLIEDLAFDFGISPRIGQEAQCAIDQLSGFPPPVATSDKPTLRPRTRPLPEEPSADRSDSYQKVDSVPPPGRVPSEALVLSAADDQDDEQFEQLDDDEVEAVQPEPPVYHSGVERRVTCEGAFAAGRAIGECSFHRDEGGDFVAELEGPFGGFVDSVGGSWDQLRELGDVELWLGAIDNLLETLPPAHRDACEWYEIGFQLSTLRSIAEQGMPEAGEQRAICQELWNRSMAQLRTSAAGVGVAPRDIRRLQAQLENLIGPDAKRDYSNISRVLEELRALCAAADRGELQLAGRATG